jgi:hypothetical protein
MSNDPILDRLVKIRKEFERILIDEGYLPELPQVEREQAKSVGLTIKEAKGWLKTEPDFTKRIAQPLDQKRKRKVYCIAPLLLLLLSMPHSLLLASAPNEISQVHAPNIKVTLPWPG